MAFKDSESCIGKFSERFMDPVVDLHRREDTRFATQQITPREIAKIIFEELGEDIEMANFAHEGVRGNLANVQTLPWHRVDEQAVPKYKDCQVFALFLGDISCSASEFSNSAAFLICCSERGTFVLISIDILHPGRMAVRNKHG